MVEIFVPRNEFVVFIIKKTRNLKNERDTCIRNILDGSRYAGAYIRGLILDRLIYERAYNLGSGVGGGGGL